MNRVLFLFWKKVFSGILVLGSKQSEWIGGKYIFCGWRELETQNLDIIWNDIGKSSILNFGGYNSAYGYH